MSPNSSVGIPLATRDSDLAEYEKGDEHHYVSIMVNDGYLLLTRQGQCNRLTLPEFGSKLYGPSFASGYLKDLSRCIGFEDNARLV